MLRDAIFMIDKEDLEKLMNVLTARGWTEDQKEEIRVSYMTGNGRCRRRIPPGPEVAARVHSVPEFFREIDPGFITNSVWKNHLNNLAHLEKGCLSDHPNVPLYQEFREGDDSVFKKMKTARGTSPLEGSHFHIADSVVAKRMSISLFELIFNDKYHR
jgi:hypothetical protein